MVFNVLRVLGEKLCVKCSCQGSACGVSGGMLLPSAGFIGVPRGLVGGILVRETGVKGVLRQVRRVCACVCVGGVGWVGR